MARRGRPRGSGYDDVQAIAQVVEIMRSEGLSRRSAIIRVCGLEQLRRIERKMTASARDNPAGNSTKSMVGDIREEMEMEIQAKARRLFDDNVALDQVGYYDVVEMSEFAALYRTLGFSVVYAGEGHAAAT